MGSWTGLPVTKLHPFLGDQLLYVLGNITNRLYLGDKTGLSVDLSPLGISGGHSSLWLAGLPPHHLGRGT